MSIHSPRIVLLLTFYNPNGRQRLRKQSGEEEGDGGFHRRLKSNLTTGKLSSVGFSPNLVQSSSKLMVSQTSAKSSLSRDNLRCMLCPRVDRMHLKLRSRGKHVTPCAFFSHSAPAVSHALLLSASSPYALLGMSWLPTRARREPRLTTRAALNKLDN